jgi:hypothetical protein
MIVNCPSGLTGEIRKLKGKEANILADRKLARKGETYDQILKGCWVNTIDPGPYERYGVTVGEEKLPWGKILSCDRYYALTSIRINTHGPEYSFKVQCGSDGSSGCGKRFSWDIDISKDLDIYDLPKESRLKISEKNNEFKVEKEGIVFTFKLLNGDDERRSNKLIQDRGDKLITSALEARIVSISKVENRRDHGKFLEDLDVNIQLELLDEFEKVDGGIDTSFEVECPNPACGIQFEVSVPLEGSEFWLPHLKKKFSKEKSREKRTMHSQ